jgi:hypothetical protein
VCWALAFLVCVVPPSLYWCLAVCPCTGVWMLVCGSYIVLSLLTLECGFLVLCPPLRSLLVFVLSLLSHSLPLWAVSFWCLRLCPCLCACCACSGLFPFGVFVCARVCVRVVHVLGLVSSSVSVFWAWCLRLCPCLCACLSYLYATIPFPLYLSFRAGLTNSIFPSVCLNSVFIALLPVITVPFPVISIPTPFPIFTSFSSL